MQVSIVIANFNGSSHLPRCLSALAAQTLQDFDIILVDNASKDDSLDYVRKCHPNVQVMSLDENLGFAGGTNVGIRAARGEYVALLNNDAYPEPAWLDKLVATLERDPQYSSCASRILFAHCPDRIDRAGDLFTIAGVACMRGHGAAASEHFLDSDEVFGPSAAAALYRRSFFDDVGLFDEDFFCLHEDVDLAVRGRLRGHRCVYAPDAVVHHASGASLSSLGGLTTYWGQRNLEYVFLQNLPWQFILRYFHHHLLFNICAAGASLLRGHLWDFLRAKCEVAKNIRPILAKRRIVQTHTTVDWRLFASGCVHNWLKEKMAQYRFRHSILSRRGSPTPPDSSRVDSSNVRS